MVLAAGAMKHIMRLHEYGIAGKAGSLLISPIGLAKNNLKMEQDCLPVDYSAFNRFHHGGKVREQDIQVLRDKIASGQTQDKKMLNLEALLERYERHVAAG